MKVIIVEDEKLAAERLQLILHEYDPAIEVLSVLESVEETVRYLKTHPHPDLLLLDVQLSDGHSFNIFKQITYTKPVVFITAYDQYAINAFSMFSIDYILKPISREALAQALNKFHLLSFSFSNIDLNKFEKEWNKPLYKKRFIGRVGQRLFFTDVTEIAFFHADNKIVYLTDRDGNKYVIDYTLEKLETVLDPSKFFRLNRRFIVNIDAIQQVKPYYNSRLKLYVKGADSEEEMIISREKVADFKLWAEAM